MSTSEQQKPLTRREMRERGLLAPLPAADNDAVAEQAPQDPEPRQPVDLPVDLDAVPLTRRQAREIERIRTASVPVQESGEPTVDSAVEPEPAPKKSRLRSLFAPKGAVEPDEEAVDSEDETGVEAPAADAESVEPRVSSDESDSDESDAGSADSTTVTEPALSTGPDDDTVDDTGPLVDANAAVAADEGGDDARSQKAAVLDSPREEEASDEELAQVLEAVDDGRAAITTERATVSPELGASLLQEDITATDLSATFDELIGSTEGRGSSHTASALILSQTPDASLSGPITATGEILITGSFELPEGFASRGHARGVTDDSEADAVLLDRELPAASSPTPIAASSAIGTIKPAAEVIRPPAPEKGSKLMLALTITAGALAAAVIGALVVAFTSGVF